MVHRKLGNIIAKVAAASDLKMFARPIVMRIILLLAVVFFLGGIVVSILHQPDVFSNLDWRPLVLLMAFGVPLNTLLNALEFNLSARLIGRKISLRRALEIAVIGSAANMLPLPGAALTRLAGLKAAGGSYGEGAAVTGLIALVWFGVALIVGGTAITLIDDNLAGPIFVAVGVGASLVGLVVMTKVGRNWWTSFLVAIVKILFVTLDALRIYLCLVGLGIDANYLQASAFVIAGVVGSAVSIVPAGLGAREAVSAVLAPVVGLAASVGFLAASLNRLLGMLVLLPLALALAIQLKTTEPLGKGGNTQP